jgi:hypothetical protein
MRENFFFFLNKSERKLNRGKGKMEVYGSSKSDVTVFGKAQKFSQFQLLVSIIDYNTPSGDLIKCLGFNWILKRMKKKKMKSLNCLVSFTKYLYTSIYFHLIIESNRMRSRFLFTGR